MFPLRHAYSFQPGGSANAGSAGIGTMSGNWTTLNPPVGAWITYNVQQEVPADTKLVLTPTNNAGAQVRRCELDRTAGLRRFAWPLTADPGLAFTATGQVTTAPAGAGAPGGGRGGGGGADSVTAPVPAVAAAPQTAAIQPCVPAPGAGGFGGGGGGGGRGGGGGAQRVPTGIYRASIGKMVGTTVAPIGPSQTFEVKALLAPQPW